jgi:hypothetical protein
VSLFCPDDRKVVPVQQGHPKKFFLFGSKNEFHRSGHRSDFTFNGGTALSAERAAWLKKDPSPSSLQLSDPGTVTGHGSSRIADVEIAKPAADRDRMGAMREQRRMRGMGEVRSNLPDARLDDVQLRAAGKMAALDPSADGHLLNLLHIDRRNLSPLQQPEIGYLCPFTF